MRRKLLASIFAISTIVQVPSLHAQETQSAGGHDAVLEECLANQAGRPDVGSCFGLILEACEARFPAQAAVPAECWEEELSLWNALLNSSYQGLIEDIQLRGYSEFEEQIRLSQSSWQGQMDIDCRLEVMSNPRTYDAILPACRARTTKDRVLFLRDLFGADWTPF